MKYNQFSFIVKVLFWLCVLLLVAVGSYFIVHNAHWIIGDDFIIIRRTGIGKPFKFSDTIGPENGRFFPFAYLAYDLLLLPFSGKISPKCHYALQAVFFAVFVISFALLFLKLNKNQSEPSKHFIALLSTSLCVIVVYPLFLVCYTTSWCMYALLSLLLLFSYSFYENQKWVYGILALLCYNYCCYCLEVFFVLPLSIGVIALVFQKNKSVKEKTFDWLLVASAILYLVLYLVLVFPHIETAYDGSHGESVGVLKNAIRMMKEQKILVLAFIVLLYRIFEILNKKASWNYHDTMILAAGAYCCGCFLLKLNWTLYYNVPLLVCLPSFIYYLYYYLGEKSTILILVALLLFEGGDISKTIKQNQRNRKQSYSEMQKLSTRIDEVDDVYWYTPESDDVSFNMVIRDWKYECICTYLGWMREEKDFELKKVSKFECQENTLWMNALENGLLFPEDHVLSDNGEPFFYADGIEGYWVLKCD